MAAEGLLIVLLVEVVAVVLATVDVTLADVLAISGTRTIEPGRAFGNVLLDADEVLAAFTVAHGSDTVTGVAMFAVGLATGVAVTLHVS